MDKVTIERINQLHPKIKDEVLSLVDLANKALSGRAQVRIVQGYRSFLEQDLLYSQGRTDKTKPKVTNAKAGQSFHNYGLAIDFCLLIDGNQVSWDNNKDWDGDKLSDWTEVVNVFLKAGGWVWGKAFNDMPHLEKTFGNSWQSLLAKYNNKQFIQNTNFVQI